MQTPQLFISVIPALFGVFSFIWHMQQVLRNDYNVLYEQTMYVHVTDFFYQYSTSVY